MRKGIKKAVLLMVVLSLMFSTGILTGCGNAGDFVIGETVYGKTVLQVTEKGAEKTKLKVPNGVEYIAVNAFLPAMLSVTEVQLPSSLKRIGEAAFSGCTNLRKVTFDKKSKLESIDSKAFYGCQSLENLTLTNPTMIKSNAFYQCSNLILRCNATTVPTSTYDFSYGSIKAMIVPSAQLADYKKVYNFTGIYGDDKIIDGVYLSNDGKQLDRYLGTSRTLTVPATFTKIAESAFKSAFLEKIVLPEGVTQIGASAFSGSSNLCEVTLPASLQVIPLGAFSGLRNLTAVNLPKTNQIQSIGSNAFQYTSISGPLHFPAVTEIGESAFASCTRLTEITLGNRLTTIGSRAFENCTKITKLTIPASVTSVESLAFFNWEKNQTIQILGNTDNWSTSWNYNCKANII